MTAETIEEILVSQIYEDANFNCRGAIAPVDVIDLVNSIKERGLIQPIVVQPYDKTPGKKYRIIAGYRRYKAHVVMQAPTIKSIVRADLSETDALVLNLIENVARKDLRIDQEAAAISKLHSQGLTQTDIASKLQKNRSWVQVRTNFLDLPKEIQQEAAAGMIDQNQIKQIHGLRDPKLQFEAVRKIKEAKERGDKAPQYVGKVTKKPATTKKRRTPHEVSAMKDYLLDNIGGGLHANVLAWVTGDLSDYELYCKIHAYAIENGIEYILPDSNSPSPYLEKCGIEELLARK